MTSPFPGGNPGDPGYWEVIFDIIPFPVYVADCATHDIICANRAMRQRVQIRPGDKCFAAIYQQPEPCGFCRMPELIRAGGCGETCIEFEHFNDIDDRWYQLRETLVAWFDGRRAKHSIAVDISAMKEVQNALAEAHAELALKNRRLNGSLLAEQEVSLNQRNFLAMVSHEFRIPLSIITAAAQVLDIYNAGRRDAAEETAKIHRAVHRMSNLIDVCLADERLASAVPAVQPQDIDLYALVDDILTEKRDWADCPRLGLAPGQPVRIMADAGLLRVAVSNLIDNALKYSAAQDGAVDVALGRQDGMALLSIRDRGPGIPPHERGRIFEKFYRSPSATGIRGAGLGLYIVKQIIDRHAGGIEVSQAPGGGALFTLRLPAIPDGAD